ncbi:hypothetical protein [Pandoravirus japonicus]|uniref:Uncharacterized protein n=1 Tax=Pandoravirus japonicus TaxID=2823154 RepID=A0A811BR52_9VIRU|nr:hypothetical protein [Pandoravirus japonicus]
MVEKMKKRKRNRAPVRSPCGPFVLGLGHAFFPLSSPVCRQTNPWASLAVDRWPARERGKKGSVRVYEARPVGRKTR